MRLPASYRSKGRKCLFLTVIDPPPANLSERAPLNGRFLVDFVQNSPFWLREFMRLGGGEISSRVRRKGRVALQALVAKNPLRIKRQWHAGDRCHRSGR